MVTAFLLPRKLLTLARTCRERDLPGPLMFLLVPRRAHRIIAVLLRLILRLVVVLVVALLRPRRASGRLSSPEEILGSPRLHHRCRMIFRLVGRMLDDETM